MTQQEMTTEHHEVRGGSHIGRRVEEPGKEPGGTESFLLSRLSLSLSLSLSPAAEAIHPSPTAS